MTLFQKNPQEYCITAVRGKFGEMFSTLYFDLFKVTVVFLNSTLN